MPLVEKEVLEPGSYWIKGRKVTFSPERIRHFAAEGNRMLEAGLPIRAPLDHLAYADPLDDEDRKAKDVLYNKGFVKKYRINSEGKLISTIDIPDATFAERLKTEIPFVSPRILPSFTDGQGRTWQDIIAHVALTPNPVWSGQKPFGTALALSFEDLSKEAEGPIELSLADAVEMAQGFNPDKARQSLEAKHGVKLAAMTMPGIGGKVRSHRGHPSYADPSKHQEFHEDLSRYHQSRAEHHRSMGHHGLANVHNVASGFHKQLSQAHKGATHMAGFDDGPEPKEFTMEMSGAKEFAPHKKLHDFPGAQIHTVLQHPKGPATSRAEHRDFHQKMGLYHAAKSNFHAEKGQMGRAKAHAAAYGHHDAMIQHYGGLGVEIRRTPKAYSGSSYEHPKTKWNEISQSHAKTHGATHMADETPDPDVTDETETPESPHDVEAAVAYLKKMGIHLPDDTDESNLVERICLAAHQATAGGDEEEEPDITKAAPEPTQIAMSHENEKLKKENRRLKGKLARTARDAALKEIQDFAAAGLIPEAKAQQWTAHLTAQEMSLIDGDDKQTQKILNQLELVREMKGEKDRRGDLLDDLTADLSHASPEKRPEWHFPDDAKAVQDAVSEYTRMAGVGGNGQK